MRRKNQPGASVQRYLAMRLGEEFYACDLNCIQEIVHNPELDPSFEGSELLVGMFAGSRGSIPVVDLLARTPDNCPLCSMSLVIFERSGKVAGMLADNLVDVVEFDPTFALPLRDVTIEAPRQYIDGRAKINGSDFFLVNLDKIVSEQINTLLTATAGNRRGVQIKGL
jgi:chemotaxis signal transduction protein